MWATASQSRASCCISVQMKSYPAFAIAQYVAGSVALNSVPPVTFSPRLIFSFTGFQIFEFAGAFHAVPYFHWVGSNGPWLTAPAGAVIRALLCLPAGAASGNCVSPGRALFAYGSAVGLVCGVCVCASNVAKLKAATTMVK